jgi:hypothetical protein
MCTSGNARESRRESQSEFSCRIVKLNVEERYEFYK